MTSSFYELSAQSIQGQEIKMDLYKGKTILIVNTATLCKFTPQFEGLESLFKKYQDKGLVVLGFPCNQFGNQEPGNEKSILEGCVINYGVSFQMFAKINVNGVDAHPLYKYLKKELVGLFGSRIKWNFTKFLIDKNGKPLKRFSPIAKPKQIDKYLQKVLI